MPSLCHEEASPAMRTERRVEHAWIRHQDLSSEFDTNGATADYHDAVGCLDAIRVRLPQSGTQLCRPGDERFASSQHKPWAAPEQLPPA